MIGLGSAATGLPVLNKAHSPVKFDLPASSTFTKALMYLGFYGEMSKELPLIGTPGVDRGTPWIVVPPKAKKTEKKDGESKLSAYDTDTMSRFEPFVYASDTVPILYRNSGKEIIPRSLRDAYERLFAEKGVVGIKYKPDTFRASDGERVDGLRPDYTGEIAVNGKGSSASVRARMIHEAMHDMPDMDEHTVCRLAYIWALKNDAEAAPHVKSDSRKQGVFLN